MGDRGDEPVRGEIVGDRMRAYSWDWSEAGGRRNRLPWFGIFLLVFGGLLLLRQAVPQLEAAGSLLLLAIGIAFLVSWLVNRGGASLYLGAILTALAAPDLLAAAAIVEGPGVGTFCLGVAFLAIAAVRAGSGGGVGWQAVLGAILVAIGGTSVALPSLGDVMWPALLIALGALLILRAGRERG